MCTSHLLFRIIGCIYEETKKGTVLDTILAIDNMTSFVSINELVIKEQLPHSLHELSFTVHIDVV